MTKLEAAQTLLSHVAGGGALGKKGAPNAVVKAAQTDMGMAIAERDGIFGPKTKAFAESIVAGAQVAAAVLATPVSPLQAAQNLKTYVATPGVNLGSKANPATAVKASQRAMGMPAIEHDGIFGPKTQAAMESILAAAANIPTPPTPPTPTKPAAIVPPTVPPTQLPPPPPPPATSIPAPTLPPLPSEPAPAVAAAAVEVPEAAKPVLVEALRDFSTNASVTTDDFDAMIANLAATVTPSIQALSDAVKLQDTQREVTSESKGLRLEDERWDLMARNQQVILERILDLAKRVVATDAITKRAYKAYGVKL